MSPKRSGEPEEDTKKEDVSTFKICSLPIHSALTPCFNVRAEQSADVERAQIQLAEAVQKNLEELKKLLEEGRSCVKDIDDKLERLPVRRSRRDEHPSSQMTEDQRPRSRSRSPIL